jgi:hypothetical protein
MENYIQKIFGLILIATLLSTSQIQAQTTFGLKGGVNYPSWKISLNGLDVNTSKSTKYVVGGFLNYELNESVSIQPEILYQVMGNMADSIDLSYISIPLLFKFALTDILYVEAGPQFGLLLGASSKSDTAVKKSNFKTTDIQFLFGGGIKLTEKVHAGFRYGYGLSNIMSSTSTNAFQGTGLISTIKNNSLSVVLS